MAMVQVHGQLPDWLWARAAGGGDSTSIDKVVASDVDPWGNTVLIGHFSGTMTLGATTLTATGAFDAYVAKLDPGGNWLWAVGYDGANLNGEVSGIVVDADGNSYITGNFAGSIAIADTVLPANGGGDMYVAKLDAAGQWSWVASSSGNGPGFSAGIDLDPTGSVYITGTYGTTEQWGPIQLASSSNITPFVARLDPSGNWMWVTDLEPDIAGIPRGLTYSQSEGAIVAGVFQGQLIVGPDTLMAGAQLHGFVAAVDTLGTPSWAWQSYGPGGGEARDVVVDDLGRIFIVGAVSPGTTHVGDSTFVATSYDAVVIRLQSGGTWVWSQRTSGPAQEWFHSVDVHVDNWILASGSFSSGDVIIGDDTLSSAGGQDGLIAAISPLSNWVFARSIGGAGDDQCFTIAGGPSGSVHVGGMFSDEVPFGTDTLGSAGGTDGFIAKLGVLPTEVDGAGSAAPAPWLVQDAFGPSIHGLNEGPVSLVVFDAAGRTLHQRKVNVQGGVLRLDPLDLSRGIYLLRITQGSEHTLFKFAAP